MPELLTLVSELLNQHVSAESKMFLPHDYSDSLESSLARKDIAEKK
jgi:hypothetical protein